MTREPHGYRRSIQLVVIVAAIMIVAALFVAACGRPQPASVGDKAAGVPGQVQPTPTTEPTIVPSITLVGTSTTAVKEAAGTVVAPAPTATPSPAQKVSSQPSATRTPTLTPIIVTPRAEPENVFVAATRAFKMTADAAQYGTPTATPPNMITATYTPGPVVITNTPTPANAATEEVRRAAATVGAQVYGTATPLPAWFVTATNTPTRLPPTATPTPTDTPVWIALKDIRRMPAATATPGLPSVLVGKILFMSDLAGGKPRAYAMNPDGTEVVQLTADWPYLLAAERDAYSADKTYRAYPIVDISSHRPQINAYDYKYNTSVQLTTLGSGKAWAPAYSPDGGSVAFVSNSTRNDEIWVVKRGEHPEKQLTHNTWEWDHHPTWSPDGKQIVFSSNRSGKQQLWIMNADGTNQQPLTPWDFAAWDPVWVKFGD